MLRELQPPGSAGQVWDRWLAAGHSELVIDPPQEAQPVRRGVVTPHQEVRAAFALQDELFKRGSCPGVERRLDLGLDPRLQRCRVRQSCLFGDRRLDRRPVMFLESA